MKRGGCKVQVARERLHRVVVAGLLWIWLSLLLYASQNIGYMGDTLPIIGYIAVLLFAQFVPGRTLRWTLVFVVALVLIKWEYYAYVPWLNVPGFLAALFGDLSFAVRSVLDGQISLINDGVRTLAFLGVVSFGTKLLEECLARPLWLLAALVAGEFGLINIAYTYGVTDTTEMVLFLAVGVFLLALANLPRVQALSGQLTSRAVLRQMLAPAIVVTVMVVVGLALPKPDGTWPKPLALLRELEAAGTAHQSYNAHDNSLGGPFEGTTQVMLRVFANQPSYYRGESMDTYTGTGWVDAPANEARIRFGRRIPESLLEESGPTFATPTTHFTEKIEVVGKSFPVLFGGYQVDRVTIPGRSGTYRLNVDNGTIDAGSLAPGTVYTVSSSLPDPTPAMLSRVNDSSLAYAYAPDLELPASLPTRDRQLADQITAGKVGTYAKVEAIIQYLQSHETYDTQDVPYLQPGQDYVDQFLFVTHRGYCDNFSSALAVLARAVGIPSRWVKGFVTVPPDPHYHGKTNEYVLRGTDAHSWAEIWFAGYGWIPMEATPSFVLPQALHQPAAQSLKHPVAQHTATPKLTRVPPHAAGAGSGLLAGGILVGGGLALLALAVIALITVYATRRRRFGVAQWDESTERMDGLLSQVLRLFGRRKTHLTLREYAQGVEDERLRTELLGFVAWYERWRYGGRLDHGGLAQGQQVVRELALHRRRRGRSQPLPTDSPTMTH